MLINFAHLQIYKNVHCVLTGISHISPQYNFFLHTNIWLKSKMQYYYFCCLVTAIFGNFSVIHMYHGMKWVLFKIYTVLIKVNYKLTILDIIYVKKYKLISNQIILKTKKVEMYSKDHLVCIFIYINEFEILKSLISTDVYLSNNILLSKWDTKIIQMYFYWNTFLFL